MLEREILLLGLALIPVLAAGEATMAGAQDVVPPPAVRPKALTPFVLVEAAKRQHPRATVAADRRLRRVRRWGSGYIVLYQRDFLMCLRDRKFPQGQANILFCARRAKNSCPPRA